jgi:type VI secretion system secreted protein Hcp
LRAARQRSQHRQLNRRGTAVASDIHIKIGDIKGESSDEKHRDEIDVDNWSWGASNPGSMAHGGGGGTGKVAFRDLAFVHKVDKASPNLWKACATGEHIKEATLTSAKQGKGPQDFLVIKLSDVLVTSIAIAETNGTGSVPTESVTLQFARVDLEYKPQKPDGSLDAGVKFKYDIKANKEV